MDLAGSDLPTGARKGDIMVDLYFDVPTLPGDDRDSTYRDLRAGWYLRDGVPIPVNGWAKNLQDKRPPIGGPAWMNC